LVIATVRGGRQEQTWRNLARAIELAGALASPDGAIAACCELSDAPNGLLRRLAASQAHSAVEEITPGGSEDALVASTLSSALQRGPVYLRSLLSDDVVEQLGMTPVANDGELARLALRRRRCVVIEDAHRVELQRDHSTA
jgi:hypothetical protein